MTTQRLSVLTSSLEICYEQTGSDSGKPIILLHGFPYDVRQYDKVRNMLARTDRRIIVPYLRGYGPTRYLTEKVIRSGQQAALGKDVVDLMDALSIERAILAGYDWGGRAACVVAALWPSRVAGLISTGGYAIQNIAKAKSIPVPPQIAHELWYQSYFNTPQGVMGLEKNRKDFCRFLWNLWSPTWLFNDEEYEKTAVSFENPDFVATVIQSYRHRYANAPGDPALDVSEAQLAEQPKISISTIVLQGADDKVEPPETTEAQDEHFIAGYRREVLPRVGHCVPAEAPLPFSQAIESFLE